MVLEATVTRLPTVTVAIRPSQEEAITKLSEAVTAHAHPMRTAALIAKHSELLSGLTGTASSDLECLCTTADNHRYQ